MKELQKVLQRVLEDKVKNQKLRMDTSTILGTEEEVVDSRPGTPAIKRKVHVLLASPHTQSDYLEMNDDGSCADDINSVHLSLEPPVHANKRPPAISTNDISGADGLVSSGSTSSCSSFPVNIAKSTRSSSGLRSRTTSLSDDLSETGDESPFSSSETPTPGSTQSPFNSYGPTSNQRYAASPSELTGPFQKNVQIDPSPHRKSPRLSYDSRFSSEQSRNVVDIPEKIAEEDELDHSDLGRTISADNVKARVQCATASMDLEGILLFLTNLGLCVSHVPFTRRCEIG